MTKIKKIKKSFEYRRVRWFEHCGTAEQNLREAWGEFDTQQERTVDVGSDNRAVGMKLVDFKDRGVAIHCAKYIDGQSVGTITKKPSENISIGEQAPRENENFMKNDFIAFFKGNHVICFQCMQNAGSLRNYLIKLFEKAQLPGATSKFEIARIACPNKLTKINELGVKQIGLKINIAEASASALEDKITAQSPILEGVKQFLGSLFKKDNLISDFANASQSDLSLIFRVPDKEISAAKEGFDTIASDLVDDENEFDNFNIHLRDGKTVIKSEELIVRKVVFLEATANTVDVDYAVQMMLEYYEELLKSGQIEA